MFADRESPKKHKSHCINVVQWPQIWCGEGDLNPHEIAPASTSSQNRPYRRVSSQPKYLIYLEWRYPPVSPIFPAWLHFWLQ